MNPPIATVESPCSGVCRLDNAGLCLGCRRDIEEIRRWSRASDAEKREILARVDSRKTSDAETVG